LKNPNFWASGISIVAHMKSPKVPAFHFNTRFIVTTKSWFGGGMDMTPCIKDINQKKYFHSKIKNITRNIKKIVTIIFIYPTEKNLEATEEYFLITLIQIIGAKILITQKMLVLLF
jgi:coproporphyrinogen III oxidase